jgi:hypothetical protein
MNLCLSGMPSFPIAKTFDLVASACTRRILAETDPFLIRRIAIRLLPVLTVSTKLHSRTGGLNPW